MSLAPRCSQCHIPTRAHGLCAVCQAGVPVHRIEMVFTEPIDPPPPPMAPVPDRLPDTVSAPRSVARPRVIPEAMIEVPCETPGCHNTATYHAQGWKRLKAKQQLSRCFSCRQTQRRVTMAQAWERYKAKHAVSSS